MTIFNRCDTPLCKQDPAYLEIYTISATGGVPTRLTHNNMAVAHPYSPDTGKPPRGSTRTTQLHRALFFSHT